MSEANGVLDRGSVVGGKRGTGKRKGSPKSLVREGDAGKASLAVQGDAGWDGLRVWSYVGVGTTLSLSAWLNGLAFEERASSAAAGWVLGLMVPILVLVFARVSALLWGRGQRWLAGVGGCAVLSILALSVQHLAGSISRLTGEAGWTAALMAVAVDAGLVVCELATVRE